MGFALLFSGLRQVSRGCFRPWVAWGHWWWLACQLIQQGRLASCPGKAAVIDYSANHPKSPPSCPAHCQAVVNKQKSLSSPTLRVGAARPCANYRPNGYKEPEPNEMWTHVNLGPHHLLIIFNNNNKKLNWQRANNLISCSSISSLVKRDDWIRKKALFQHWDSRRFINSPSFYANNSINHEYEYF